MPKDFSELNNRKKRDFIVNTAVEAMFKHAPQTLVEIIEGMLKLGGIPAKVHIDNSGDTMSVVITQHASPIFTYTYPWGRKASVAEKKLVKDLDSHTFKARISRGPGGVSLYLQDKDPKNEDRRMDGDTIWDVLDWLNAELTDRDSAELDELTKGMDVAEEIHPDLKEDKRAVWADVMKMAFNSGHRSSLVRSGGHWYLIFDDVATNHSTVELLHGWLEDRVRPLSKGYKAPGGAVLRPPKEMPGSCQTPEALRLREHEAGESEVPPCTACRFYPPLASPPASPTMCDACDDKHSKHEVGEEPKNPEAWLEELHATGSSPKEAVIRESEKPAEESIEEEEKTDEELWVDIMDAANKSEHNINLSRTEGMWHLQYGDIGTVRASLKQVFSWLKEKILKES